MSRRRRTIVWMLFIVAGVFLALLLWQVFDYRSSQQVLPAGMTVAGMGVGGKEVDQALADLEVALAQEIEVRYQEETLLLPPESVGFRYDAEATREAIDEALAERRGLGSFVAHVLRRPVESPALPAVVAYSTEAVDAFLNDVAQEYDRPPRPPVPLLSQLSFRPGEPGYQLDLQASRQRLADALRSAVDREVALVVQVDDAPPPQMDQLETMLATLVEDFDGVASVFVKDLQTGEELGINDEVAYAGMSVLKIALMVETYRTLDGAPTVTQTHLLSYTVTESENHTANQLLMDIGGGEADRGALTLTSSMARLGLVNTFMAGAYDDELLSYSIVTPANARTDVTTEPDPHMQITGQDAGLLLEMIYHCSQGGGALMIVYPGSFTPGECREMLALLSANRIDSLIEVG
ncbi:MAG: peptidoglycan binding domain-containing protein, partial [Anaerolineae bacterium]